MNSKLSDTLDNIPNVIQEHSTGWYIILGLGLIEINFSYLQASWEVDNIILTPWKFGWGTKTDSRPALLAETWKGFNVLLKKRHVRASSPHGIVGSKNSSDAGPEEAEKRLPQFKSLVERIM